MGILPQLVVNSVIAGATYTLITLGFNLIYGTTKFINMAHGAVAAVGGYTVFFLTRTMGAGVLLSIVAGVVFAGLIGYGMDKIVFTPLRKRNASNLVLFIASLGIFTVIQAVLAMFFTSQFQTLDPVSAAQGVYQFAGAAVSRVQLIIIFSAAIFFVGLTLFLKYTNFGKAVRAISDDEEVARMVGINTDKVIGYVFFIGSAIAGLAGILIGFDVGIQPTMGLLVLLQGAISSIIGGIGNIYGGVMGSFLLGFAENFGIWKIAGEWKVAISFGLLILFLIFRPEGIMKK